MASGDRQQFIGRMLDLYMDFAAEVAKRASEWLEVLMEIVRTNDAAPGASSAW